MGDTSGFVPAGHATVSPTLGFFWQSFFPAVGEVLDSHCWGPKLKINSSGSARACLSVCRPRFGVRMTSCPAGSLVPLTLLSRVVIQSWHVSSPEPEQHPCDSSYPISFPELTALCLREGVVRCFSQMVKSSPDGCLLSPTMGQRAIAFIFINIYFWHLCETGFLHVVLAALEFSSNSQRSTSLCD